MKPPDVSQWDAVALWTGLRGAAEGRAEELTLDEWKSLWVTCLKAGKPWFRDQLALQQQRRTLFRQSAIQRAVSEGRPFAAAFHLALSLDEDPENAEVKGLHQQAVATLERRRHFTPPRSGQLPQGPSPDEIAKAKKDAAETAGHSLVHAPKITGKNGADWCIVPAGRFRITPSSYVVLAQPFYLGETEVTVAEFRKFVEATGHVTDAEKSGGILRIPNGTERRSKKLNWRTPGFPQTEAHPVAQVSWRDAVAYCDWLTQTESARHRLPTEAEWQWACLAGTTIQGGLEDRNRAGRTWEQNLRERGWFRSTTNNGDGTRPVRQLKPNRWGLYDMHGNLCEWVSDYSGEYPSGNLVDPVGPAPHPQSARAARGGMFDADASGCTAHARGWWGSEDFAAYHFGFRVLRQISED